MKTTKSLGDEGEDRGAKYLQNQGFEIIDRNWRTLYCEIDIIAKKDNRVYFVEVKARKSGRFGEGLAYITSTKIKQMSFAAEIWVQANNWLGDYQLAAIGITGDELMFIDSF